MWEGSEGEEQAREGVCARHPLTSAFLCTRQVLVSYLDTSGRPVLVLHASNLVEEETEVCLVRPSNPSPGCLLIPPLPLPS